MTDRRPVERDHDEEISEHPRRSRRSILNRGAAAAAVGAVAGVTMSKSAAAADGDPMVTGDANTGTSTTSLSGGSSVRVDNGSSELASILGVQNDPDRSAVTGEHTADGPGVIGSGTGSSSLGVFGSSTNVGVAGSGDGVGVLGVSALLGVVGAGDAVDLLAGESGVVALDVAGTTGVDAGRVGDLARDDDGNLYFCYASGSNRWRRVAGPGTAGSFHPVAPTRVFDSRFSSSFASGSTRLVNVARGIDIETGAAQPFDLVPAGATAVTANVTVASTIGRGFVAINPGGDQAVRASAINWSSDGLVLGNAGVFKLDLSRGLQFVVGGAGATQIIFDVTGYYL